MLETRPQLAEFLLDMERLLRYLPDEAGYVAWLEAPYGYGKSVLLSQWAAHLDTLGRSTLWVSLSGTDARSGLALALNLPDDAPWPVILSALRTSRTAIVLEDLEGNETLGPLLRHLPGVIALASRRALPEPELVRLRAVGRLVHLGPQDLAFTLAEAEAFFHTAGDAQVAWARSGGWPLPLHLSSLTGGAPFGPGLWAGLRDSLRPSDWHELLVLSALSVLPAAAADSRAERLARLGFVQQLEGGYRLHPLAGEDLGRAFPALRDEAVRRRLPELPAVTRALACANASLWSELARLLDDEWFADLDAPGVLRWHEACAVHGQGAGGPGRWLNLAWAWSVMGQTDRATRACLEVARHPDASPAQRVRALGWAISELPEPSADRADQLIAEAEPWLSDAPPPTQACFWGNAAVRHMNAGRWAEAERLLTLATDISAGTPVSPNRMNLAQVRWEVHGDLTGYLDQLRRSLASPDLLGFNRAVNLGTLGTLGQLLDPAAAGAALDELGGLAAHHPLEALRGRAEAAALRGDVAAFPALDAEARAWAMQGAVQAEETLGRVVALWGRTLRSLGRLDESLTRLERPDRDPLIAVEMALTRAALGEAHAALDGLKPALHHPRRELRITAHAARYRLTHDPDDLDALLGLTTAAERVLPALVPLADLPRNRPELTRPYPLAAVLAGGWREATRLRLPDIPPLHLTVLGGFGVQVLGESVGLQARPRDLLILLILLALNHSRAAAAELIWPEADPARSRNNLHVNLNALRRVVEPWGVPVFLTEAGLSRTECDLWDLQAALTGGHWAQVRAHYRPLLPEVTLEPVIRAREELHRQVTDGALLHARTLSGMDAEDWLDWILTVDALHEGAMTDLLTRMVTNGRRGSAQRRYQIYRRRLRDELGLEPDGTLQALFL
ncbi:hypothetical protein E7T09_09250 [Deinococcus sp. KSM4-11]|uniref:BTAD domain-containing putative transcriptional regulator n=1 Tax=Deinococcus sp. KSM4-11 TaxID=2568654 RepID=UPI0010A3BD83|nr:BTAD domain-containing putative transcriptional regulator [Deinococcus sp. KSM4-11]THF87315.1 hypothetical protein E7T09_09250 [Deinococcus sp. KSM4-11]